MKIRFSPTAFSIGFCCAYIGAFALNSPLFIYYPMHREVSWGRQVLKGIGPGMAWYGLMVDAAIVASLLAICIPERHIDRPLRNVYWLFPCGAMLGCAFLLRQFFL